MTTLLDLSRKGATSHGDAVAELLIEVALRWDAPFRDLNPSTPLHADTLHLPHADCIPQNRSIRLVRPFHIQAVLHAHLPN